MTNITFDSIETIGKEKEKKTNEQVSKFDVKNYLNVRLDTEHGILTREIKIRLLPIDGKSDSAFQKIHMHYAKVNKKISQTGFKNYVCLEKTDGIDREKFGNKCPFCEIKKGAWKAYTEATDQAEKSKWLELFKENCSDEYAIIRCIERGKENEGPKFWKFRLRSDEKDPMNTIIKLFKTRRNESIEERYGEDFLKKTREEQEAVFQKDNFTPANILDIYNGKDLKITLNAVYSKQNELTDKISIDIADYGSSKPVSFNEEQMNQWINDEKTWADVFAVKPYEYLEIVSEGGSPYFDKKDGKWVKWDDNYNDSKKPTQDDIEVTHDIIETTQSVKNLNDTRHDSDLPF